MKRQLLAAHLVSLVMNASGREVDVVQKLVEGRIDMLLGDGLPLDPEPPTLPPVVAYSIPGYCGPNTAACHFVGSCLRPGARAVDGWAGPLGLQAEEAMFSARLLNALPTLRELANAAPDDARHILAQRLGAILAILNDEVKP